MAVERETNLQYLRIFPLGRCAKSARLSHRLRGMVPRGGGNHNMADFLALIDTVPGQVTLEVFASKSGWTKDAMEAELLVNAPLARYFVEIVGKAVAA